MGENRLRRGEVLFHEGDPGDKLYIVTDGKVKLGRTSSDGRENLLAILGPGEMFGELSLFDPGPRTATATAVAETQVVSMAPAPATAVAETQVVSMGHDQLKDFLSTRPGVASTLLAALARRLRRTNEVL